MAGKAPELRFSCIDGCTICCVIRDYPRISFIRNPEDGSPIPIRPEVLGKEGIVELEAWELPKMVKLAKKLRKRVDDAGRPINYRFVPARGIGRVGVMGPEVIFSYWLLGQDDDGDTCPFLSTETENMKTGGGSLKCLIYEDRPLQCRAYPVHSLYKDRMTGDKVMELDQGCQWVVETAMRGDPRVSAPLPTDQIKGVDCGSFARLRSGHTVDPRKTVLWTLPTGVYGPAGAPDDALTGWVVTDW